MILTNKCIMKLRAPGFAQVHKAAETGNVSTGLTDVPPAEVRWAIPWQVWPQLLLALVHADQGHPVLFAVSNSLGSPFWAARGSCLDCLMPFTNLAVDQFYSC